MNRVNEKKWILLPLLVLACIGLLYLSAEFCESTADAQISNRPAETDTIKIIPIQLDRDTFGLAMVDINNQTLWIYEVLNRGPQRNRLRLLAARSWKYDRLLEQYNTDEPTPEQVRNIISTLTKNSESWQNKLSREQQPDKNSEPNLKMPDIEK